MVNKSGKDGNADVLNVFDPEYKIHKHEIWNNEGGDGLDAL
jgi:hypothetical protein